jgi:hypothetical protein
MKPAVAGGYKRFNGLVFVPKKLEEKIIKRYHEDVREAGSA